MILRHIQINVKRQKIRPIGQSYGNAGNAIIAASNSKPSTKVRKLQSSFGCSTGNAQSYRKVK